MRSMRSLLSLMRLRFLLNRLRERLWLKPLLLCLLSIGAAFVAKFADGTTLSEYVPKIDIESLATLLSIMASSMLVIATFSVGSMVSAYASASTTATPRSFSLVIADGASQNALSTFVGAFIFSIVALTAVKNSYFEPAGVFILFLLTIFAFSMVIVTFVRWVDQIARLGRMGTTIDKVERTTAGALRRRLDAPYLRGVALDESSTYASSGTAIYAEEVGYVQQIDMAALQSWAEDHYCIVRLAALPGTLLSPRQALVYVLTQEDGLTREMLASAKDSAGDSVGDSAVDSAVDSASVESTSTQTLAKEEADYTGIIDAFQVGADRLFDDDPRFGLVVLSEIAGRALSPAVNDPGTAIKIIGTFLRLFVLWDASTAAAERALKKLTKAGSSTKREVDESEEPAAPRYQRVLVPQMSIADMFDDAFTSIARDGAGMVEVALRLQKALRDLAAIGGEDMRTAALAQSRLALARARAAMAIEEDVAQIQALVDDVNIQ